MLWQVTTERPDRDGYHGRCVAGDDSVPVILSAPTYAGRMSTEPLENERLSSPSTSTGVLEREEVQPQLQEPGDHERFSHYVKKEKILESALSGDPVTALCGKVWVPGRDPQKFPVCPACKEVYEKFGAGGDDSGD